MLDRLTRATFEPLLGARFRLHAGDGRIVEITLAQADKLPAHPGRGGLLAKYEPFSLVFHGPKEFVLPQRTYLLEQETLGKAEIFLVPIGPDEIGQRYEAVFN